MNYSQDEFFELMDQVEAQGGTHLDEMCKAKTYEFTGDRIKPATLPGCGNVALFDVPFLDNSSDGVTVCAVDDDMGKWPRFGGDRFAQKETHDEG